MARPINSKLEGGDARTCAFYIREAHVQALSAWGERNGYRTLSAALRAVLDELLVMEAEEHGQASNQA